MSDPIDPSAVLWSDPESERRDRDLLVLLHGYGSDERELFSRLVPLLSRQIVVASLRGPVAEASGFAWVSLETSLATRSDDGVAAVGNDVAGAVLRWLVRLPRFRSIGLLGVSQGGCIALQLLRAAPLRFDYAINLSGYSLPGSEEGDAVLQRIKPPVFWGRGRYDTTIPPDYVERTLRWLLEHSTLISEVYEIGHTESDAELADVAAFIGTTVVTDEG